jgi:hypothetical protein
MPSIQRQALTSTSEAGAQQVWPGQQAGATSFPTGVKDVGSSALLTLLVRLG